jgi:hypothetical protein
VAPPPRSPSWLWLRRRLRQINRDWNASLKRLSEKNSQSVLPLELPEASFEKLLNHRRDAACVYVQRRQIEMCPAKGSLTRDQVWLVLLHQARDVYHEALGTEELAQAHTEIPVREYIVLGEARGDLERADVDRSGKAHCFRADHSYLKRLLFRAAIAQAKALRDRRDGGEWWFPAKLPDALTTTTTATGCPPTPAVAELPEPQPSMRSALDPIDSRRRPGRKPKRITESYRLVAGYLSKLDVRLSRITASRLKITKANLARAFGISKDTINLFERESTQVGRTTRDRIQTELTTGPTEEVIAYFVPRKPPDA